MERKVRIFCATSVFIITMTLFCIISLVAVNADDAQKTDEHKIELSVKLSVDEEYLENVKISIYRVFEIPSDNSFNYHSLTDKFKKYPIDSISDTDDLRKTALTIEGFIAADNISSDYSASTDNNGLVYFYDIPKGLYLVCGEKCNLNNTVVFPTSFFVRVDDNRIQTKMKYEKQYNDTKTSIEAIKVWQDGSSSDRPESITVSLYCDGKIFQNRVLSKDNNWKYKWNDLDSSCKWIVTEEKVPSNYKVTVSKQENCFIITNKTESGSPKIPSGSLPQTGMLIWPIPILFIVGIVLIAVGILVKRRKND